MSLSAEMFSSVFRVVWNPSALFVTKYKLEVLVFQNVCIQTQGENVSFKQGSLLLINASLNNWSIYNLFLIFEWIYCIVLYLCIFCFSESRWRSGPFFKELPPLQEENLWQHVGASEEAWSCKCSRLSQTVSLSHFVIISVLLKGENVFAFQVRTGYDGLGGRTKFIQPVSFLSLVILHVLLVF